jgi:uncharacterized protein YkwD
VAAAIVIGALRVLPAGSITDDRQSDRAATVSTSSEFLAEVGRSMRSSQPAEPASQPVPPAPTEEPPAPPPAEPAPTEPPVSQPPQEPPPPAPTEPPPTEWLDPAFAAQVLAIINGLRAENGAGPLIENGSLTAAASSFSQTLTQLQVLDHGAGGSDLLGRVQAQGFTANVQIGEVLWFGTGDSSAGDPVDGWMGSPPHHDLILDPGYHQAGVGCFFRNVDGELQARCVVDLAG